ncbi:TPA: helix-turn-helix transcriptional regulator [Klebsiella michiganensis]|jgi:AraC-like DNA-binding protein|uniref:helix-turn-helix transcriptional regulator n=1 Tax=Klebsiella TaxID=570 RepID=UPI0007CD232F|nr:MULTISPECIES: AraC family transcriptional regulator [Klebsiella]MBA4425536.1 helix-turn-helix transcriptional regulator [Klebsiella michiganensis]MBW5963623.1 AraC family transcriptional regulator [Klebsiella michiganensis]MDK3049214.1 AraC family transcriptional regulator [Klebsiella michiganensis]MDU2425256.1 AraC family transcriptional regulator [Klebsiella michiganensis]MDU7169481.1 AraC family transcriptional regulator [Klebsiella sp.]
MPRNKIQRSVLSELVQWIKNNLEKRLTMRALSLFSGYSEWHLFRLFRHYFNMSPMAYIRQQRMQLALDLLKVKPAFRIVDICIMAGYEDISAFNRTFKRYYAITPGQFRKILCISG